MTLAVTVWKRWDEEVGEYVHNHVDNGHVKGDKPKPRSKDQAKKWKDAKWQKTHCWMRDGRVLDS